MTYNIDHKFTLIVLLAAKYTVGEAEDISSRQTC